MDSRRQPEVAAAGVELVDEESPDAEDDDEVESVLVSLLDSELVAPEFVELFEESRLSVR